MARLTKLGFYRGAKMRAGRRGFHGPKATVLRMLVHIRLMDAWALLNTNEPQRLNGTVYLAGYAVECALKARICHDAGLARLDRRFWGHDLWQLLHATRRSKALETDRAAGRLFETVAEMWYVALRYEVRSWDRVKVRRYLGQAEELCQWLFER